MQTLAVLLTALTVLAASAPREQDPASPRTPRSEPPQDQRSSNRSRGRQSGRRPKREVISPVRRLADFNFDSLRGALEDLSATFGSNYPEGARSLARLSRLEIEARAARSDAIATDVLKRLRALERQVLVASHPALDVDQLLVLKRQRGQHGLPVNHKCNSGIERSGYDNEIAVVSEIRSGGKLTTLFRPRGDWFVGELLEEIAEVALALKGKRLARGVRLWVCTAYATRSSAERLGYAAMIRDAGAISSATPVRRTR